MTSETTEFQMAGYKYSRDTLRIADNGNLIVPLDAYELDFKNDKAFVFKPRAHSSRQATPETQTHD